MKYRVLIADFIDDSLAIERDVLADVAELEALQADGEEQLWGVVDEADAMMMYHCLRVTSRTIERMTRCKIIVRCGVGYDNVDYRFARSRGIVVANVPDYGTEEVADSAIGLMLSLTRGITQLNSRLRDRRSRWTYKEGKPRWRLRGRTFAIVGLGRIGTAAALRAKALGMDVAFFDPYKPDGYDKALGVRRVESLEELLREAFVLSIHCPLNDETRHLIDAEAIAHMPRGSFLINTARGGIVDTAALPGALAEGRLAGAGIDVLETEPPPEDHPLLVAWRDPSHPAHDRLLLNPHTAFYSEEGLNDMRRKGAETCRRALLGEPVRNVVN